VRCARAPRLGAVSYEASSRWKVELFRRLEPGLAQHMGAPHLAICRALTLSCPLRALKGHEAAPVSLPQPTGSVRRPWTTDVIRLTYQVSTMESLRSFSSPAQIIQSLSCWLRSIHFSVLECSGLFDYNDSTREQRVGNGSTNVDIDTLNVSIEPGIEHIDHNHPQAVAAGGDDGETRRPTSLSRDPKVDSVANELQNITASPRGSNTSALPSSKDASDPLVERQPLTRASDRPKTLEATREQIAKAWDVAAEEHFPTGGRRTSVFLSHTNALWDFHP
jgi:hypothetical protein